VFHLASHVSGSRELSAVRPTFEHNLITSLNLLEAVTEAGCRRLVLAGSLEEPDGGDVEVAPASPYAAAKWAASAYARMFHALWKTPVVIARLFMVYGPGQQDLQKIIPYVALSLMREQTPTLASGTRPVDWIYVEDAVAGLAAAAAAADIDGHTVDLGSGELVTIRAMVEELGALIPSRTRPLFGARPDRPLERVRAADIEQTFARIGWRVTTPLRDGLVSTIAWCETLIEGSVPSSGGDSAAPSVSS
jgi:nucleoside-diphosphate-sugar epimerase